MTGDQADAHDRSATTLRQEHPQHCTDSPGHVTEVEFIHEIPVLVGRLVQQCRWDKRELSTDDGYENVEPA